jgi:RimJ/RimL family protein N-acetyltransferase
MPAAYRIVTKRLVLRCLVPGDAGDLRDLVARSRAGIARWVPLPDEADPLEVYVERLRASRARFDTDGDYNYAVIERATSELVGMASLETKSDSGSVRQVGGWLRPDIGGRGLGGEFMAALTRVALEGMGVARLEIVCDAKNEVSVRLAERLGFMRVVGREDAEQIVYELNKRDLRLSPAAGADMEVYDVLDRRVF